MTIQINGLIASAMYFMLGLISYLMIGDYSVLLWSDPWVYVYMAFWPIIWIWFAFLWILAIVVVIAIIFFGWTYWDDRHIRKMTRDRRAVKQELMRRAKKP